MSGITTVSTDDLQGLAKAGNNEIVGITEEMLKIVETVPLDQSIPLENQNELSNLVAHLWELRIAILMINMSLRLAEQIKQIGANDKKLSSSVNNLQPTFDEIAFKFRYNDLKNMKLDDLGLRFDDLISKANSHLNELNLKLQTSQQSKKNLQDIVNLKANIHMQKLYLKTLKNAQKISIKSIKKGQKELSSLSKSAKGSGKSRPNQQAKLISYSMVSQPINRNPTKNATEYAYRNTAKKYLFRSASAFVGVLDLGMQVTVSPVLGSLLCGGLAGLFQMDRYHNQDTMKGKAMTLVASPFVVATGVACGSIAGLIASLTEAPKVMQRGSHLLQKTNTIYRNKSKLIFNILYLNSLAKEQFMSKIEASQAWQEKIREINAMHHTKKTRKAL